MYTSPGSGSLPTNELLANAGRSGPQHGALAGGDDDWLTPQPVAHLGEWMPDVLVIALRKFVHDPDYAMRDA